LEPVTVLKSGTPEHARLVYRLKNSPVIQVANTVNTLFRLEGGLHRLEGAAAKDAPARNVAIVPQTISNSLVISGAPDAVEEVRKLVDELDQFHGLVQLEMEMGEVPAGTARPVVEGPKTEGALSAAVTAGQFRLLEKPPHMETVARVRLTTLDNQPALAQMGARVPRVTDVPPK